MEKQTVYAFLALTVISMTLSVLNGLFSIREAGITGHKFCDVVHAVTKNPVAKPANPAANPSREQNYEGYILFVNLGKSLGC